MRDAWKSVPSARRWQCHRPGLTWLSYSPQLGNAKADLGAVPLRPGQRSTPNLGAVPTLRVTRNAARFLHLVSDLCKH